MRGARRYCANNVTCSVDGAVLAVMILVTVRILAVDIGGKGGDGRGGGRRTRKTGRREEDKGDGEEGGR